MITNIDEIKNIYVDKQFCDMRKHIDGLALIVASQFNMNVLDHSLFIFTYKQAGRILLFSLDDYSLEEWTEAVNYISQTRQKFATKEAARDFLYVLILTKAKLYDL